MKHLLLYLLFSIGCQLTSDAAPRTIHVFVALCDNVHQGIVPVPTDLGDGQDPTNNLYWGALYGLKTHFKRSKEWTLIREVSIGSDGILERLLFKHDTEDVYLLADAYDGRMIRQCTTDFLSACAGEGTVDLQEGDQSIRFSGCADILAYIGHDGLMDFTIESSFHSVDDRQREAIILACASKSFFSDHLKQTGAYPLIWTTGLMAPEAYTLEWALNAWAKNEERARVVEQAGAAYHHYQKCGMKGASRLLVQGW